MYIASTGMVSPIGLNAEASCAATRAGIANFVELPYADNSGEPVIGSTIPGFDFDLKRSERIIKILIMTIKDCLPKDKNISFETVPLLVGMAEAGRPGAISLSIDVIIKEVERKLGIRVHPKLSQTITKGHTSGFEALRLASELLRDSRISACLVCGIDSYINASSLLWLDSNWRLKTVENSDGVIPGEAGASILIRSESDWPTLRAVRVVGLGFSNEKTNVLSEEPLLGLGLSSAARSALSDAGLLMHQVDLRISDATGESYGFREHSLALARVMRIVRQELPIWHCADSIGDTGAAAGLCQLVVGYHAFVKGYAPGNKAICFTSATPGDRAVAVLQHGAQ